MGSARTGIGVIDVLAGDKAKNGRHVLQFILGHEIWEWEQQILGNLVAGWEVPVAGEDEIVPWVDNVEVFIDCSVGGVNRWARRDVCCEFAGVRIGVDGGGGVDNSSSVDCLAYDYMTIEDGLRLG